MGSNLEDAQKKLDKALKRNLEKQIQNVQQISAEKNPEETENKTAE